MSLLHRRKDTKDLRRFRARVFADAKAPREKSKDTVSKDSDFVASDMRP
jgi:hypothetical protein